MKHLVSILGFYYNAFHLCPEYMHLLKIDSSSRLHVLKSHALSATIVAIEATSSSILVSLSAHVICIVR